MICIVPVQQKILLHGFCAVTADGFDADFFRAGATEDPVWLHREGFSAGTCNQRRQVKRWRQESTFILRYNDRIEANGSCRAAKTRGAGDQHFTWRN